ncbi:MAG: DUF2142 domain-containing protein [FCB group bacterium]|jgi:uncharacterized membrane protein
MKKKSLFNNLLPLPIEYIFIVLGLIFGILFIFINPPFQTNDEDRHFYAAYSISEGQFVPYNKNNMSGTPLPRNLVMITQSFQGIPFYQGTKINVEKMEQTFNMPLNEKDTVFNANPSLTTFPIPYFASAIGIKVGGIINSNPIWLNRFGRFGDLIMFLLIMFFAIRITPIFKSVFLLYGLTPMVIYQAASVTYDTLSIALTFFMIALFLKYALIKDSITRNDIIFIILLTLLHRFSKDGYVLIPFLVFIIPPKKLGSKSMISPFYIGFTLYFVLLYFLPGWTWNKFIASLNLLAAPGGIKDFVYGNPGFFSKIISEPFTATGNMITSTLFQRQDFVGGIIGRFGYSYTLMPKFFMIVHGLVLLSVAFFESKKEFLFSIQQRVTIFLVGIGSIVLIIVGWYLSSPIGSTTIWGLQGRYFIPAIPIVLLLLYNNKFENPKWIKWKGVVIGLYIIISLIYTLIYMSDKFYV